MNAAECANSLESKSEDDGFQPNILIDGKEVGELYHNDILLVNVVQTSVAIGVEKDTNGIFEMVQRDNLLAGIGVNDKIR